MLVEFWKQLELVEGPAALETAESTVSYQQLKQQARSACTGLAGLVSLHFPKSVEYAASVLACWSAGAAFVPVDPQLPPGRQKAILDAARPDQQWHQGNPPTSPGKTPSWAPGELAYVICTSGSSGQPRAVEVGHAGLVPMLRDQIAAFDLRPGKRALWLLSSQFDASLSDLGTALLSGATLCIPPPSAALELPYWLDRFAITHVDLPPALLRRYRPEDFPPCVETLVVGGEASPPEVLRRWAKRFRVISVYGPTEATICTHLRQVDESWDAPYLGEPIGGMAHRVVDGELWLSGPGLARGYRDGHDHNFVVEHGVRYYRTGDRVDPHLVFQGRTDRQVKVRGHRVELEEIESQMLARGATRAAAMLVGERLLAFYEGQAEPDLRPFLPAWMLPQTRKLEHLPLTASGKVDRQALLALAEIQAEPLDSLGCLQRAAELQAMGVPVSAVDLLGGSPQAMTCESLLKLAPRPAFQPLAAGPFGPRVLLTGAHGQLGRRLLNLLLRDHQVFALVRRPLEKQHPNLVEIRGDLRGDWKAPEVDCVLHCAAVVNSVLPFERLRETNLDSLRRLVDLGKPFHYASTLSVFVSTDFQGLASTGATGQGQVYGGYAQSKWLAEQWLSGLGGVWCYRYGLLVGYPEDPLRTFLRGLLSLGAYPVGPEIRIDTTSIDWAAQSTLELARGRPGTYHLASPKGESFEGLVTALQRAGHRLRPLPAEEFFRLPVRNSQEGATQLGLCRLHPDPAFFQANRALDLFQATDVRFELSLIPPAIANEALLP